MARSSSGPLFMLSWNFDCMTPTTVNGIPSSSSISPTGSRGPNRRKAIESPRKRTRRRSVTSASLMKRPPLFGYMRRMSEKAGWTPSI